jgi:hypothetical protein
MIKHITSILSRILSPIIEPIIQRLEDGMPKTEHEEQILRIEKYAKPLYSCHIPKNSQEFMKIILTESEYDRDILELMIVKELAEQSVSRKKELRRQISIESLSKIIDGNPMTISNFRSIYLAMESFIMNEDDIEKYNKMLIQSVPINQWAAPSKIVFGRSFMLLYLASSYQAVPDPNVKEYLKAVSERILRVFEIKQQNISNFSESSNSKIELLIEQLRLINFLLRLSENFKDLRFLNASLKANDRILPLIKKVKMRGQEIILNDLALTYYRLNVYLQESQMRNLR